MRLLSLLLCIFSLGRAADCPSGYQLSADSTRCFILQTKLSSFSDAESDCIETFNGHLASIRSGFDNTLALGYVSDVTHLTSDAFWIGSNRLISKFWSWTDGSSANYSDWANGEPTDGKNCAGHYSDRLTWLACDCNAQLPYLCEILAQGGTTTTQPPPTQATQPSQQSAAATSTPRPTQNTAQPGSCSSGYTADSSNCYKVISTTSAASAESTCTSDGGHLVSIHSDHENDFVNNLAQQASPQGNTWIGLVSTSSDNNFAWTDGTPLDYTHWRAGQPSSGYQYVMMYTKGDSLSKYWEDWEDNHPQVTKAVCKKSAS